MVTQKYCDKCKKDITKEKTFKVTIRENILSWNNKDLCVLCGKNLEDWFHQ